MNFFYFNYSDYKTPSEMFLSYEMRDSWLNETFPGWSRHRDTVVDTNKVVIGWFSYDV